MSALTASGVGTCGPDDNQAQAGHLVTHTLTAEELDASEDGTGRGTPLVPVTTYRKSTHAASSEHDETWVEDDKTNTLNTFDNGDTRAVDLVLGVGLHGELSGGTDDIAQSVTTSNGQPGGVINGLAVRRLTPTECERLQGLPDDWTATGISDDGKTIRNADSARYRFCGNGGAVPVMEWILARLLRFAEVPGDGSVLDEHDERVADVGGQVAVADLPCDEASGVPDLIGDADVA